MKTNKLAILFTLLSTIFVMATFTSCIKKLKGTISVSGTIIDEYTRQPIPNIYIAIGRSGNNGYGGISNHSHILSSYYQTDVNGNFSFSYESGDKIIATLSIKDFNPLDSSTLNNMYSLHKFGNNLNGLQDDNHFATVRLKDNNTSNIQIEFTKKGTFKLNLLKNNSIASDTVQLNNNFRTIIKNDTSIFTKAEPNYLNKYQLLRNKNIIWKDSIYFDNKGDTLVRTVQL
jgi:hypothetical protein